ncbi:hypothetical protein BACCAP_02782 [Pseudoflavonifractor capillosus ATCC 29799]|uniref:Uncharacterized protein n=1 Tax=Pseudoflavonifractor capillosus ATCC 29799 TaxID=411467 RepID=A6NX37_9FIRM|nr:hypothetical protein BACCAP_02782 [Pseudoflavonifractor capillosus ATCC 29799]
MSRNILYHDDSSCQHVVLPIPRRILALILVEKKRLTASQTDTRGISP